MTLSALGIFSAAGAGGATGTYELIESYVLGSSQTSVTFSNLGNYSSTYKHLQIRYVARTDRNDSIDFSQMTFNADSATNYSYHYLRGGGSSVSSLAGTSTNFMWGGFLTTANSTASVFSQTVIDILEAYSTSKNKTIKTLSGINTSVETSIALFSGLWRSTSSVTSITLDQYGTNFVSGSRFSIYGIRG
jgi:hypothetical protein